MKVNIDEHPRARPSYGVLSIPTVILFEDGEPQETVVGARPRVALRGAFGRWLDRASLIRLRR